MPLGTYIIQLGYSPKISIAIGSSLGLFFLLIASWAKTYAGFFWAYSLSFSLLGGFAYMVPVHHGWLWFPKHPGLATGLIIGGYGLSGLIFNNVATAVINPQNLKTDDPNFDQTITDNFVHMQRVLWGCYFAIRFISIVTIFKGSQQETRLEVYEPKDQDADVATGVNAGEDNDSLVQKEKKQEDLEDLTEHATIKEMLMSR